MKQEDIKKGLIERVEELLIKTKSRVEGKTGDYFWTARKVRQGCLLSPLLFNLIIVDLEKEMVGVKCEGGGINQVRRKENILAPLCK